MYGPVPIGFEARDNGVLLRFSQPVKDADAATCFAQCWNYRYGPQYGSPEYSVKYADTPGHDPLEVRSVQKLDGGKTLYERANEKVRDILENYEVDPLPKDVQDRVHAVVERAQEAIA